MNSPETAQSTRPRRHSTARSLLENSPGLIYLAWAAVTGAQVSHSPVIWDPILPGPFNVTILVSILIVGSLANAAILNWLCQSLVRQTARISRSAPCESLTSPPPSSIWSR